MKLKYEIKESDTQKSIHTILKNELQISSRLLTKLIKHQKITINQTICNTKNIAKTNDLLEINFDFLEDNSNITPTQMNLDIIYEDEWMLIVNKPAGISIHPSCLHYTNSLSNGIKFYFDSIGLCKKIRPVNRLDLDTSGLVLFAKCAYIQESLIRQMHYQIFQKEYLGITQGFFEQKSGSIHLPIARKSGSIIERCIDKKHGQLAITHYKVIKEFHHSSFMQYRLETGRTHQIRVHMAAMGHPLLGDSLYGKKSDLIARQALHSYKLTFVHPISKNLLTLKSPLPKDMELLLLSH